MTEAGPNEFAVDLVVFGGGVAGLWLLNRLRQRGYRAVLLEAEGLGAGQTRYSQGIIHGGTKYALTGKLTGSSEAIAAMPALWRACLAGTGEVDLSHAALLSPNQFMWSTESITSRMAGFFASKLMRSRVRSAEGTDRPQVLRDKAFRGQVYRLEEPVLDTASLIHALADPYAEAIGRFDGQTTINRGAEGWQVTLPADGVTLNATKLVFAAGAGNAALLAQVGHDKPEMQRRPLNMVMVRGGAGAPLPGELYAHCLGASANPRITITSHRDAGGELVWYLGGDIAEGGVGRSDADQVAAARAELESLFPWTDFSACQWGTLPIDRAEVKMADGSRPADVYFDERDGVFTAWPTKLALAPRLANEVIDKLVADGLAPGAAEAPWPTLTHPGFARLPWQEEQRWL